MINLKNDWRLQINECRYSKFRFRVSGETEPEIKTKPVSY